MDAGALKKYWPLLKGLGGGAFTLLFTLSLLQGLFAGRKQSKVLKQQEEQMRQQAMMGQVVPGYGLSPGQMGQGMMPPMGGGQQLGPGGMGLHAGLGGGPGLARGQIPGLM